MYCDLAKILRSQNIKAILNFTLYPIAGLDGAIGVWKMYVEF